MVLHEAGVPPIHTPIKALACLSDEIKERLQLIHVAEKDIPSGSGLRIAKTGLENTLVLISEHDDQKLRIIRELNLIQNVHLFQNASFKHIRDLFELTYDREVKEGEEVGSMRQYLISRSLSKATTAKNSSSSAMGPSV